MWLEGRGRGIEDVIYGVWIGSMAPFRVRAEPLQQVAPRREVIKLPDVGTGNVSLAAPRRFVQGNQQVDSAAEAGMRGCEGDVAAVAVADDVQRFAGSETVGSDDAAKLAGGLNPGGVRVAAAPVEEAHRPTKWWSVCATKERAVGTPATMPLPVCSGDKDGHRALSNSGISWGSRIAGVNAGVIPVVPTVFTWYMVP
jgi:hypothetical protein